MRTKTSILAAAIIAAGVASSMAQSNVYSINVVGYANIPLTNGFTLFANQFDNNGLNTLGTIFSTNLPDQTQVYKFTTSGGYSQSAVYLAGIGWLPDDTMTLNPGEGVFVSIPTGGSTNITLVGNVLNGPTINSYNAGFNIISSQIPESGLVSTDLGFAPQDQDQLFFFDSVSQTYASSAVFLNGIGWLPSEPTVTLGQAFFLQTAASANWTNSFTVH